MLKVEEAKRLLDYCITENQRNVISLLAEGNKPYKVAEIIGMASRSGVNNIIRRVRGYAAVKGYDAKANLDDGINGMIIKGVSDFKNMETGELSRRWIKYDQDKQNVLNVVKETLEDISSDITNKYVVADPVEVDSNGLINVYISNDLHFGALMWEEETGNRDYNLKIAETTLSKSIDYLVENSPTAKVGIVVDLGDMTEMDDYKNATPKSGHSLDVDGRYSKVLGVTVKAMINLVNKALTKHEVVHFINVEGNHDITTALAVRIAVEAYFHNEPRVIVDTSPKPIKYYTHGSTLLGFAHGDGLKMKEAGEAMAVDNEKVFSDTVNRYFHFGHTHKDSVYEGRLCKSESHRNLAPLNHWAASNGYRRQLGTAKCITYSDKHGEISRAIFNVDMV